MGENFPFFFKGDSLYQLLQKKNSFSGFVTPSPSPPTTSPPTQQHPLTFKENARETKGVGFPRFFLFIDRERRRQEGESEESGERLYTKRGAQESNHPHCLIKKRLEFLEVSFFLIFFKREKRGNVSEARCRGLGLRLCCDLRRGKSIF